MNDYAAKDLIILTVISAIFLVLLITLDSVMKLKKEVKEIHTDVVGTIARHSIHPEFGNYKKEVATKKCHPWDDCK